MKNIFEKFYTLLFHPIAIGKYFNEPFYKSFLLYLVLALISVFPFFLMTITSNDLPGSSYSLVSSAFTDYEEKIDLKIEEGKLVGSKSFALEGDIAYIFIGKQELNNMITSFLPVVVFSEEEVSVIILGGAIYSQKYGADIAIDFGAIQEGDALEMNKLFSVLDQIYGSLKVPYSFAKTFYLFIGQIISTLLIALLFSFMLFLGKPFLPMQFRFKIAFDSLMVTLLFNFVYNLTGWGILQIAGEIVAFIYMLIASSRIVGVGLRRKDQ